MTNYNSKIEDHIFNIAFIILLLFAAYVFLSNTSTYSCLCNEPYRCEGQSEKIKEPLCRTCKYAELSNLDLIMGKTCENHIP